MQFKTHWWYFSGTLITIMMFFSLKMYIDSYEKAQAVALEAFLTTPQPGAYFVFVFKEDERNNDLFSIGKIEKIKDGNVSLSFSRRSHWEQGNAMATANDCLNNSQKCRLPGMLTLTLQEFKQMGVSNFCLPKK